MSRSVLPRLLGAATVAGVALVVSNQYRHDRLIQRRVDRLLASARPRAGTVDPDALSDLPDPVRTYLETVLPEDREPVETVRLRQTGEFRLGDDWKPCTATQHVTVDPPAFLWDASVRVAPLVSVRVVDSYDGGAGSLEAKLLSTVTVARADPGPGMNSGELARYLAEAVWYPTALVPGAGVEWEPIDDRSARATITDGETTASLSFHFDDDGLVERVHSEGRYRQDADALEPWTGHFRAYEERNGVLIPTEADVGWDGDEGGAPYWRGTVEDVDYRTRGAVAATAGGATR